MKSCMAVNIFEPLLGFRLFSSEPLNRKHPKQSDCLFRCMAPQIYTHTHTHRDTPQPHFFPNSIPRFVRKISLQSQILEGFRKIGVPFLGVPLQGFPFYWGFKRGTLFLEIPTCQSSASVISC